MEQLEDLEKQVAESERAVEIYREERGLAEVAGAGLPGDAIFTFLFN